jgi:hypothetical protein
LRNPCRATGPIGRASTSLEEIDGPFGITYSINGIVVDLATIERNAGTRD